MNDPSLLDLIELDIDVRLAGLWTEIAEFPELDLEVVAPITRCAYGAGYVDALTEVAAGEREKLARDHGFRLELPGMVCRLCGRLADWLSQDGFCADCDEREPA